MTNTSLQKQKALCKGRQCCGCEVVKNRIQRRIRQSDRMPELHTTILSILVMKFRPCVLQCSFNFCFPEINKHFKFQQEVVSIMNHDSFTDRLLNDDDEDNERPLSPHFTSESDADTSHSTSTTSQYGNLPPSLYRMGSLNNQDLSNQPSMTKSIKQDAGDYYWANFESKWTLLDQKRLVSMDYLIHRSLEFHNNHHTFRASGNFDYTGDMEAPLMSDFAMEVQSFHPGDAAAAPALLLHFGEIHKGRLGRLQTGEAGGALLWFNLKDIRALRALATHLHMPPLALSLFFDLRGRSTISALQGALFMSFCIITLNGNEAELHKVHVHVLTISASTSLSCLSMQLHICWRVGLHCHALLLSLAHEGGSIHVVVVRAGVLLLHGDLHGHL